MRFLKKKNKNCLSNLDVCINVLPLGRILELHRKGKKRIKIMNGCNLFCGKNKRRLFKPCLRRNVEIGFNKRGNPNTLLPRYRGSGRALLGMY